MEFSHLNKWLLGRYFSLFESERAQAFGPKEGNGRFNNAKEVCYVLNMRIVFRRYLVVVHRSYTGRGGDCWVSRQVAVIG